MRAFLFLIQPLSPSTLFLPLSTIIVNFIDFKELCCIHGVSNEPLVCCSLKIRLLICFLLIYPFIIINVLHDAISF